MLKCAPGVWRKCELYKIYKSLIVFEKNFFLLKTVASCPGLPYVDNFSIQSFHPPSFPFYFLIPDPAMDALWWRIYIIYKIYILYTQYIYCIIRRFAQLLNAMHLLVLLQLFRLTTVRKMHFLYNINILFVNERLQWEMKARDLWLPMIYWSTDLVQQYKLGIVPSQSQVTRFQHSI